MKYFTYYKNESTGFTQVLETTWKGDMVDERRKREGKIFGSIEAARKAAGVQPVQQTKAPRNA